ncbi:MAG: hypothetical protein GY795_09950 [Desulfobacterales bacterium]|nr:hypothetical protein [Desulfobacterales bacterium]
MAGCPKCKGTGKIVVANRRYGCCGEYTVSYVEEKCDICDGCGKAQYVYSKGGKKYYKPDPGGCFITTATCLALNKKDNCDELNMFRKFRDEWLLKMDYGSELIKYYYQIAPVIVEQINSRVDKDEIYKQIWNVYLRDCLILIDDRRFSDALHTYKNMITYLSTTCL